MSRKRKENTPNGSEKDLKELLRRNEELERKNAELTVENVILLRRVILTENAPRHELPRLTKRFLSILSEWSGCFSQHRVYERARDLALGFVLNTGRSTVTGAISALGQQFEDWSANYRLFSEGTYSSEDLFLPVFRGGVAHDRRESGHIAVALDDSSVRKTGKKIASARILRAPLSLPYWPNLERRQRFVEASVLIRPEGREGQCRAIPIGFWDAPPAAKPRRSAGEEVWAQYRLAQRKQSLGRQAASLARLIVAQRETLSTPSNKPLLFCVDGSMMNSGFLRGLSAGSLYIGRARKDAALFAPASETAIGKRDPITGRVYGNRLPTPESIRKDAQIPWRETRVYAAQKTHTVRFKEMGPVLWRKSTLRQPLRLIVIAPLGYRPFHASRLLYRDPAYLLTSDLTSPTDQMIQAYVDRWEIEVGFRDQKAVFGLGQAQVWSDESVPRLPAFMATTYGALLVASLDVFGPKRTDDYGERALWRTDTRMRPSLTDLRQRVRCEVRGTPRPTSYLRGPQYEAHFEPAPLRAPPLPPSPN